MFLWFFICRGTLADVPPPPPPVQSQVFIRDVMKQGDYVFIIYREDIHITQSRDLYVYYDYQEPEMLQSGYAIGFTFAPGSKFRYEDLIVRAISIHHLYAKDKKRRAIYKKQKKELRKQKKKGDDEAFTVAKKIQQDAYNFLRIQFAKGKYPTELRGGPSVYYPVKDPFVEIDQSFLEIKRSNDCSGLFVFWTWKDDFSIFYDSVSFNAQYSIAKLNKQVCQIQHLAADYHLKDMKDEWLRQLIRRVEIQLPITNRRVGCATMAGISVSGVAIVFSTWVLYRRRFRNGSQS